MPITVEATYENGVLKPAERFRSRRTKRCGLPLRAELNWVERTAGILKWTGDPEVFRRIVEDPEFSILEAYDHEELSRCVTPPKNPPSTP